MVRIIFQLLVAERQIELVVHDLLARQNSSKISNAVLSMLGTPRIENTTPLFVSNCGNVCFNRSEDMKNNGSNKYHPIFRTIGRY